MANPIAFVLSGGGNYGALQAGALRALVERGIRPDLLIATSAGAINAAYFAARPTPQGVSELERIWCKTTKDDVYPGTHLDILWRLMTKRESLYPNHRLRRFLESNIPANVSQFGEVRQPRLFITSAHLDTGELHLYGEHPDESILDALMASTALPPFSPPWLGADGRLHVDGGTVSNLPIGIAAQKGARVIYALHIVGRRAPVQRMRAFHEVGHAAMSALLKTALENDLKAVNAQSKVKLHYIPLSGIPDLPFFDFSRAAELIALGYAETKAYLDAQAFAQAETNWRWRAKQWRNKFARAWRAKRYMLLSE